MHVNQEVDSAIVRLADALCEWECSTGIESAMIIRERNFCFRAVNGKPGLPDDITDQDITNSIMG